MAAPHNLNETASLVVVPGQDLGSSDDVSCGIGTYEREGRVYACVVGRIGHVRLADDHQPLERTIVHVYPRVPTATVPSIGDIVLAIVKKIDHRAASVEIVAVGKAMLLPRVSGKVRAQDVRAFEKDSVNICESFQPGDLIRGEIISYGDVRGAYYISTAQNEYGVLRARHSDSLEVMIPISWDTMQCPISRLSQHRKVAKPIEL